MRPPGSQSGAKIPEQSVVRHPLQIRLDAIPVEQQLFPAGPVVPHGAPGRNGEVGPPVGDPESAEVDMTGPPAVVGEEGVGGASVAVTDDRHIRRRDVFGLRQRLLKAEPAVDRVPVRDIQLEVSFLLP